MVEGGRSGRGTKKESDKVPESPVSQAGSLSANWGEKTSSSALHVRLGRLVPADNIKRMFKTHESRGKDIFPDLSPIP